MLSGSSCITFKLVSFKNNISDEVCLTTIVEGKAKLHFSKKKIGFVAYAMVYTGTNKNIIKQSVPAISLKSSNYAS